MVAMVSRVTGLSAVDTLRAFGLLNLLLLFWALRLFVRATLSAGHTNFDALLFLLTLWGISPWMTSGFLHFNYLVQGAGYPSTFATGLVFLAWYLWASIVKGRRPWLLLPLTAIVLTVLLDHPITAGSLMIGLFALTLHLDPSWSSFIRLSSVCAAAFALAWFWPYYPFYSLVLGKSANIDSVVAHLYPGLKPVLLMIFLALIGLPALWLRFKSNHRDFLAVIFLSSLLIYAIGGLTGKYVLGRVIVFMILALQLSAADWLSRRESEAHLSSHPIATPWAPRVLIASAALGCFMMMPGFLTCLPILQNSYGEYTFLSSYVGQYDVVLSDFDTSLKIPAFRAKVVSYSPEHSLFFVDTRSREQDVQRFFSEKTSQVEREQIVQKYRVSFLLLNKQKVDNWPSILQSMSTITSPAYADGNMILLKVADGRG